ncbi:MAG: diguanylate cyclase [Gemmatimonadota bacterium]
MDGSGFRGPPPAPDSAPAAPPPRRRPSLRSLLSRSIADRIAAAAALLIACLALLLAGLAYVQGRALLLRNAHDSLSNNAVLLASRTSLMLASVERDIAGLAGNSLVVNGLLDSSGRSAYLQPFLRDHRIAAQVEATLTLVDHRGNLLSSNNLAQGPGYVGAVWLETVLNGRKAVVQLSDAGTKLLLAYPVIFPATGMPEGALVLEVPLAPLFAHAASVVDPDLFASLLHDQQVLNARAPVNDRAAQLSDDGFIAVRRPLDAAAAIDDLGLEVEVRMARAHALDGLDSLARTIVGVGVVIVLLASALARSAARRMLRPLTRLSGLAERIRTEKRLDLVVPEESADEIGQLASSFNHMIASLRDANENLEREVASRTAALEQTRARLDAVQEQMNDGLLVVDSHACIESFNGGAERLFDCAAAEVVGRGVARLIPTWHALLADASIDISEHGRFQCRTTALRGEDEFSAELSVSLIVFDRLPRWVALVRDVTERHNAEEMMHLTNRRLNETVAQLRQRDEDMAHVNRMNELLASCHSSQEAHSVIERILDRLFAGHCGALAVNRSASGLLEVVARWGDCELSQPVFALGDCWALRLGRRHDAREAADSRCAHYASSATTINCLPLSVQGETLGVLMAAFAAGTSPEEQRRLNQLLNVVGEAVKFGLSNLKLREALRDAAVRDGLTGLFNRRYLDETLPRELHRIVRAGSRLSVAVLDLDHFKRFNDGFGHEAGDLVLREVARVLRDGLRSSDLACRIGGEELVAVLPDADCANAAARLEQLREEVERLALHFRGQLLPRTTVSIGIAEAPAHGATAVDLIHAADAALYAAKTQGRNRIVIAGASTPQPAETVESVV